MKKKTRAQKIIMNKSSKGKSGYAKKVERRRKLAIKLGMDNLPLPLLKLEDE